MLAQTVTCICVMCFKVGCSSYLLIINRHSVSFSCAHGALLGLVYILIPSPGFLFQLTWDSIADLGFLPINIFTWSCCWSGSSTKFEVPQSLLTLLSSSWMLPLWLHVGLDSDLLFHEWKGSFRLWKWVRSSRGCISAYWNSQWQKREKAIWVVVT